ncbi:hypothetical protein V3C99_008441 [Haemonchus contortus]
MLGETRGGSRGDKKHGFGAEGVPSWKVAYKRWQGKQIPEDLVAHRTSKRKPGEVRRKWKEYFDRLLNEMAPRQTHSPGQTGAVDATDSWMDH